MLSWLARAVLRRNMARLNAGDYLTLVVFDQKGKFGDNRGKVDIGITYGGP